MNECVRWPRDERLNFLGRNGYGLCTGLDVFAFDQVVELRPITSRNRIGRAEICVPVAAIPAVIALLRDFRRVARQNQLANKPEVTHGNVRSNDGKQRSGAEGC